MAFNQNAKILFKQAKKFEKEFNTLRDIMGVEALKHFNKSWRDQGFTDDNLKRWDQRKKARNGRDKGRGRAILVKSGALRRSLSKKNAGRMAVFITSPLPYANVHNEGLRAGRGRGFKMPKRQFVGYSHVLMRKIEQKLAKKIGIILK